MIYLRNMFIDRCFNISAKAANFLPVICTLCPKNWVETHNDGSDGELTMAYATYQALRDTRSLSDLYMAKFIKYYK